MSRENDDKRQLKRSSDVDGRVQANRNGNRKKSTTADRRGNSKVNGKGKKGGKKKKIIIGIIVVILALIIAAVAYVASKLGKMDSIDIGDVDTNELSDSTLETLDGYTTIALFGLDNRSNGSFESGNSDTIIVASINNKTGEIRMASVYRDSYLDIGDGTFAKCNAAYQQGGPKQAVSMLNTNLDLNITDYVAVDWNALVETINLLGGVEIELTDEEASLIGGYIDEISEQTGVSSSYPSAGTQTLDGVQATAYARIRYTTGWDYKRTERQRTVITQMFEKAKSSSLTTLNSILDNVLPDISTSLSTTELLSLATGAAKYSMGENTGFPFDKASDTVGSLGSVVIPVNLDTNVVQLHAFLYDEENYTVSSQVQSISDTIVSNLGQYTAQ